MKTYNVAPMDLAMRIVTAFVFAFAAAYIIWGIVEPSRRALLVVGVALLVAIWIGWEIAPKRYDLTDDALIIVRGWPFRDISIPTAEIREVRRIKVSPITLRSFGVGGIFSWSGWFWNKQIGTFFAEITNGHRSVLIDAGRKYVISPEDPDSFVDEIRPPLSQHPPA